MEPTTRTKTTFGAPQYSEGDLSRLIPHLHQATAIGFSAIALLVLSFPAHGQTVTNGGFETTTGNASSFVMSPGFSDPFAPDSWTFSGSIGCVVFPASTSSQTNACGASFATLWPGWMLSPAGGNFVAIDGDPSYSGYVSQQIGGFIPGQTYTVSFLQAASQFMNHDGATTEKWRVTFDAYDPLSTFASKGTCDPKLLLNNATCQGVDSVTMSNPAHGFVPWITQAIPFIAQAATEVLSFFAIGTPANGMAPPVVLLDNVAVTGQNGYIEVCKASCSTNPLTSKDPTNYYFTVPGSAFSSPPGIQVPVGECSGPIPVSAGTPTIQELPTPGVSVCNVTAVGYSPFAGLTNLLVPGTFNPTTGTAEIIVQEPPSAADTSLETIVTYYNYEAPPAELKICKIAGGGVNVGTTFPFALTSSPPGTILEVSITNAGSGYTSAPPVSFSGCATEPTATASISVGSVTGITLTSAGSGCTTPVVTIGGPPIGLGNITATATAVTSIAVPSVEAGPPAEGGYCQVVSGTFPVGTSVTVEETVPNSSYVAPTVTVNSTSTPLSNCTPAVPNEYCALATIGAGINEVSFTNCQNTPTNDCPAPVIPPNGLPPLGIGNYALVSQVPSTGTQSYMTYRADLSNPGATTLGPMVARLTSLDPSKVQVMGRGELNFTSAPPNGQVPSSNTFTILTDPTVPLDLSKLSWTYYSGRSVPPRR